MLRESLAPFACGYDSGHELDFFPHFQHLIFKVVEYITFRAFPDQWLTWANRIRYLCQQFWPDFFYQQN